MPEPIPEVQESTSSNWSGLDHMMIPDLGEGGDKLWRWYSNTHRLTKWESLYRKVGVVCGQTKASECRPHKISRGVPLPVSSQDRERLPLGFQCQCWGLGRKTAVTLFVSGAVNSGLGGKVDLHGSNLVSGPASYWGLQWSYKRRLMDWIDTPEESTRPHKKIVH